MGAVLKVSALPLAVPGWAVHGGTLAGLTLRAGELGNGGLKAPNECKVRISPFLNGRAKETLNLTMVDTLALNCFLGSKLQKL